MLLTPTYHVFKMYSVHQDAELLETEFENLEYSFQDDKIPQLSVSSSIDSKGKLHISLCNLDPNQAVMLNCELTGEIRSEISGSILTAEEMNARNTFDNPEYIKEACFDKVTITNNHIQAEIPPKSVVVLEIA